MFSCKVCLEKDKRIADLKEVIQELKLILNPPPRVNHYELEQDYTMDGGGREQLHVASPISEEAQAEALKKQQEIQIEFDRIITGNYSEA